MKKKFVLKAVACVLLLCVMLGASLTVYAIPGWTQRRSQVRTFSAIGRTFQNQAILDCFGRGDDMIATVSVWTADGSQMPTGTIGANAIIFSHLGNARLSSGQLWSEEPARGINVSTSVTLPYRPNSGLFHAGGDTYFRRNNSGRHEDRASVLPTGEIMRNLGVELRIAAFMEALCIAYANDEMVGVEGINGTLGLVFARELRNSPVGYINVYAGDCLTIVDRFPIVPAVVTHIR